jgi:predicted MPP superfamily phosphohydrolase
MKMIKKRRHTGLIITLLLVLFLVFLLYDSNTRLAINEYPLYYDNLPAAFDGYRIVQLSDIHTAVFGKDNSGLINAVKTARPDIIAITGDLISNNDDMNYALGIVQPLISRWSASHCVLCDRNHE